MERTRHNEALDGQDDQHIVDVETRMAIVECQESVDRKLCVHIVVILLTQHLLAHSCSNLHLEIQNGTKPKVASLTALVVLCVL